MKIEVLGPGCPRCKLLAETAESAAEELGIDFELSKVTSLSDIASYGVMVTPALVLNGEVKLVGKVPSQQEVKELLEAAGGD